MKRKNDGQMERAIYARTVVGAARRKRKKNQAPSDIASINTTSLAHADNPEQSSSFAPLKKEEEAKIERSYSTATVQKPTSRRFLQRLKMRLLVYLFKMRGPNSCQSTFLPKEVVWAFIGTLLGFGAIAFFNIVLLGRQDQGLLFSSLGASATLVYGMPHSPFAQPRNVIGGHMISALAGVIAQAFLGDEPWIASTVAVGLAVACMLTLSVFHPPGGATALIAVTGSAEMKELGFLFPVFPIGVSVLCMVLVGVLVNNISSRRRYPLYWW